MGKLKETATAAAGAIAGAFIAGQIHNPGADLLARDLPADTVGALLIGGALGLAAVLFRESSSP